MAIIEQTGKLRPRAKSRVTLRIVDWHSGVCIPPAKHKNAWQANVSFCDNWGILTAVSAVAVEFECMSVLASTETGNNDKKYMTATDRVFEKGFKRRRLSCAVLA